MYKSSCRRRLHRRQKLSITSHADFSSILCRCFQHIAVSTLIFTGLTQRSPHPNCAIPPTWYKFVLRTYLSRQLIKFQQGIGQYIMARLRGIVLKGFYRLIQNRQKYNRYYPIHDSYLQWGVGKDRCKGIYRKRRYFTEYFQFYVRYGRDQLRWEYHELDVCNIFPHGLSYTLIGIKHRLQEYISRMWVS